MANFETQSASEKRSKSKFLILGVVVLVLGVGGVFGAKLFTPSKAKPHPAATEGKATRAVLHLESFVVNLADGGPGTYLRVGIDLGLAAASEGEGGHGSAKGDAGRTAMVRDTILAVLMRLTAQEVASAEGKLRLKQELLHALQQRLPELGVTEIYFTDFLLQS